MSLHLSMKRTDGSRISPTVSSPHNPSDPLTRACCPGGHVFSRAAEFEELSDNFAEYKGILTVGGSYDELTFSSLTFCFVSTLRSG